MTMAWWSVAAAKRRRVVVSLIEFLIVLAIIGVMADIVVPKVAGDGDVISVGALDEAAVGVQR
jgi:prepilin-type N-terminal cleavage/methylation domain-containing protein